MGERLPATCSRRRMVMALAGSASAGLVPWGGAVAAVASDASDAIGFVHRLTGQTPILSGRVRLFMPKTFPNGYTVPLALDIDTPMTREDHVTAVRVLAPKNPLVEVATFHFLPGRSQPRVATRIRLAQPQSVIALAAMGDASLLMACAWVEVATDGCK